MQFEKWYPIDLLKPPTHAYDLGMILYTGDGDSVIVGAVVTRDGEPVTLTGTVQGYVILPDGSTPPAFAGTIDGNRVSVTLPETAMVLSGRITLAIRVINGYEKTVVLGATAMVRRTSSESAYDPDAVIPTWDQVLVKIGQMDDAAQACNDATQAAQAVVSSSVRYDTAQTLSATQQAQARVNIGAAWNGDLTLPNVLAPALNVRGTHTDASRGRTVSIDRNAVTYKRNSSNSTGRAYVLTGNTFRDIAITSGYAVDAANMIEADFITLHECISEAQKRRVFLWLYSPDNPNLTLYNSTSTQQNRILLAARAQDGTIYRDNEGLGRPFGSRGGGYYFFPIAHDYPELWAQMVTNRTLAVYYICKTNNAAKDGTLYWGIGLADHDLYDAESVTGTTVTITADSGMRYECGTVTELSFTPASSGLCEVVFTAGDNMVLTLPSTVRMPDWWTGVEANRTYDLMILNGTLAGVMSWAT